MKQTCLFVAALLLVLTSACKGDKNPYGDFPKDFNERSDSQKIAYMMQAVTPDSVARFIVNASLGKIPGERIDSMSIAVLYAYEHYRGDDLTRFGESFDNIQNSLPLDEKMKMMKMAGTEDPMGLGYKLGLEYFQQIRDNQMTAEEVSNDIRAFRKSCAGDHDTYTKFVKGFKTALRAEGDRGLPKGVYSKFENMPENF